ncbi:MAG: baseplate J/gp47 family protein [Phycisphaerales bacterium]|nr:baseplate J/gp47 family protein [Chloroflexota bacterium]
MAGVTSTGWVSKTLGELQSDLRAAFRRVFGLAVNVDPRARAGQLVDIMADALSTVWELGEAVAGAVDPSGASGVLLDNLSALTNTFRLPATKSTVTLTCIGTVATALAAGRRVSVAGTSAVFETTALATIAAAPAWAASTPYAAGAIVASDSSIWRASVAGTSGVVAPNGAGPFVDGTVTWVRLGSGVGYVDVEAEATVTGPVQGFAGTLTVIDTPVSGWNAVTNALDALPGTNQETDAELRLRRQQEIAAIGTSPLDAVRAEILKVAGVTSCTVFENTTDVTVDGITPHAIEALVEGGADADLRSAIFAAVAAGIETVGGVSGTVADSGGNSHTIKFTRPSVVNIYVAITLTKDPARFPLDGDAQVRAAIVAAGDQRGLGFDVVSSRIAGDVFAAVPGVLDVTAVLVSTAPGPTLPTTIPISLRQRADFDTSRITVVSTSGVP